MGHYPDGVRCMACSRKGWTSYNNFLTRPGGDAVKRLVCILLMILPFSVMAESRQRGDLITTQAAIKRTPESQYIKLGEGLRSVSMFASIDKIRGAGGQRNGIQSFALDEYNGDIYTLHINGRKNKNLATINRYPLGGGESKRSIAFTKPLNDVVGHQGLGLEYLSSGAIRLWSTYYKDSRQVVRYAVSDELPVSDVQIYRLFGSDFRTYVSSTPTVSFDQRYIVAAGKRKGVAYQTIRVWKISDLVKGGAGDYSKSWMYEWDVKDIGGAGYPLQGIASDGRRVWIIAGNNRIDVPKRMVTYSLKGELIDRELHVDIGKSKAMLDGRGEVYEPEGLALMDVDDQAFLFVGIVSGDKGFRKVNLYKVPIYSAAN